MLFRPHCTGFFFCAILSGASWAILCRIFSCAMLSGASRITWVFTCAMLSQEYWKGFFLVQCCLEPQRQRCIGFLTVQCCRKSIKATLNRFFSLHCCLEPQGQYCIRFLPVQCCPRAHSHLFTGK